MVNLFIKSIKLIETFIRFMRTPMFISWGYNLDNVKIYRADYIYIYPLAFILMLLVAMFLGLQFILEWLGLMKLIKWLSEEV